MGCCYSYFCKDEHSLQTGDANERTHLLIDPVSNNTNIQRVNSEDLLSGNSNTLPKKTDEQSAMNRILQETATNVIDVGAIDSHNLQQHEYIERMKMYNMKAQQVLSSNKQLFNSRPSSILQDIPNPERILNSEPVTIGDLTLIKSAVIAAATAVNEIRVDHKEDLVVPFGLNC